MIGRRPYNSPAVILLRRVMTNSGRILALCETSVLFSLNHHFFALLILVRLNQLNGIVNHIT